MFNGVVNYISDWDQYGKTISMTYDGETESITTFAGGAISILIMLAGFTYLVKEV